NARQSGLTAAPASGYCPRPDRGAGFQPAKRTRQVGDLPHDPKHYSSSEGPGMRPLAPPPRLAALALLTAALAAPARAGEIRHFEDASLHAVQFVDEEGWAVGDEGVIWHTINGGKEWERQPSGVRASLRALHFLDGFTGWVAGREELPGGG